MTKVGLIGCGRVMYEGHLPAYEDIPQLRIAAIADVSKERLSFFREKLDLERKDCYLDYQKLLKREDIDFVDISVSHTLHQEMAIAASEAGKHILCEKPLATTLQGADKIIKAAKEKKVKLSVFHNYLFLPENIEARRIIREGAIGQIIFSSINALGIGYYSGVADYKPLWRSTLSLSGGGVFIDYGIHPLYLTRSFFNNEDIKSVNASIDRLSGQSSKVEDFASCRLKFNSGCGVVNVCRGKGDTGGIEIVGEKGTVKFIYETREGAPHSACKGVYVKSYEREFQLDLNRDDNLADRPFRGTILDFISSIKENREPFVTGKDGRIIIEAVLASYESAALDKTVKLPLQNDDPVYLKGVEGIRDLDISRDNILRKKRLFGIK